MYYWLTHCNGWQKCTLEQLKDYSIGVRLMYPKEIADKVISRRIKKV